MKLCLPCNRLALLAAVGMLLLAAACQRTSTDSADIVAPPTTAPAVAAPVVASTIAAPTAAAPTNGPTTAPTTVTILSSTGKPLPPAIALANLDVTAAPLQNESPNDGAVCAFVPVADMPFSKAARIHHDKRPTNPWDIQLRAKTSAPIAAGDALLATFYIRTIDTQDESGEASVGFAIQLAGPPWTSAIEQQLSAPRQWKKITLPIAALRAWPAKGTQVSLSFGYDPQTIEVADFSLLDFGPKVKLADLPQPQFTYVGREKDAPWRAAAADRIEKYRKGDIAVTVVDANGNPVPNATISVQMKRHAFGFGSAVSATAVLGRTDDDQHYRDVIQGLFNRVVMENDLKWKAWDNVSRRPKTLKAIRWLRNHGQDVRGHNMVWPGWPNLPEDLHALRGDKAALSAKIDEHITDIATALAPMHLCEWDVVNETRSNHDLQDLLGHDVLAHWFDVAHAAIPNTPLFLNENSVLETGTKADFFYSELQFLQDRRAPLGGIGLQGHFGWNPTPPEVALKRLDRFAAFGVPIEITEYDMNVSDEQLQADYTRDIMTIVFSHPSTSGFIMWGFWDPAQWLGNAPLYRKDWSLKPAGQAWIDLVFHQWWTNTTATSNAQGAATVRGFLGDYEIKAESNGASAAGKLSLTRDGASIRLVLGGDKSKG